MQVGFRVCCAMQTANTGSTLRRPQARWTTSKACEYVQAHDGWGAHRGRELWSVLGGVEGVGFRDVSTRAVTAEWLVQKFAKIHLLRKRRRQNLNESSTDQVVSKELITSSNEFPWRPGDLQKYPK